MEAYAHILRALVLRDMRTRFGGSHWGYAVLVLWPVAHITIIVGIMYFRDLPSPAGGSALLFVATACVPCLCWQYVAREVMKVIQFNKPLLYYPQVKIFDLMLARTIVEVVKSFSVLIVVMVLLFTAGVDPIPQDPIVAIEAFSIAVLLGIGTGYINVAIVSFFPAWQLGFIVPTLALYITCGTFFLPSLLPNQLYEIMKWSPLVQIVEWSRTAYYPDLNLEVDYLYMVLISIGSIALGLVLERFVVRRFS
jgi:capsular polysaccharide transport system permease protein